MANIKFEYNGKLSGGGYWDETSNKRVVVELDDNDLTVPEMLEEFMNFMQAIGYKFDLNDRFEVVNDFKDIQPEQPQQMELDLGVNGTSADDFKFGDLPPQVANPN